MDTSSLLSNITFTNLADGKWRRTAHASILHQQDQIHKYHDLVPQQVLSVDLQCTLLQNAVHPVMEVWQVKLQAKQFKTQSERYLTYKVYCLLLLSTAQQYDMQHSGKVDKFAKHRVYEHDMFDSDVTDHEFYDTHMYDID